MRRRWLTIPVIAGLLVAGSVSGTARATGAGGWDHLGHGATATTASLNGSVYALNTDNPGLLYVGGSFTDAGGVAAADYIAVWNGTTWSEVGSATQQLNGAVNAIAYAAGKVYVGGNFTTAGTTDPKAKFLAVWDGSTWSSVCSGPTQLVTANVNALQIIGSTLYVGGGFANGGGIASADRLVACDLSTGTASTTIVSAPNEFNGPGVYALAKDSNNVLYAAGGFINLEGIAAADHVAYKDGTGWHAMGSGGGTCACAVDSIARSLTTSGTDVYVGTDSKDIAGFADADNVAKWNGSTWSAVGSNTANTDGWFPTPTSINSLKYSAPNLFATGTFVNADGDPKADNVAVFDGANWHSIGSNGTNNGPLPQAGDAITIFQSRLHVGGQFTSAGDDLLAHGVARYPGFIPECLTVLAHGATGGVPFPIHLHCSDANHIPVAFQIRSQPAHGALGSVSSQGNVTYTPAVGYQGPDEFTYRGTNSDGDSATTAVDITVANRGYKQSAQYVAVRDKSLTPSPGGTLTVPVHNTNNFTLHATSLKVASKSHGIFASSSKSTKVRSGKTTKLAVHLRASKLKLLKRLGHVKVSVTIKYSGPHHSHSTGTSKGTLHAPH
jgi:hypothetical protein